MKRYPRILTVQDISCLGQCSTTVALPILSACGCETCVLPTMVLSTHTGGLGEPVRHDLTADIPAICAHWQQQSITFDGIYVGYLGKKEQIAQVVDLCKALLAPEGKLLVDPAMADHGKLYSGLDEAYAAEMRRLCAAADVIVPNWTEACMLAGMPYAPIAETDQVTYMLADLHQLYGCCVVLTGAGDKDGNTSVALQEGQRCEYIRHKRHPGSYHGTGDMFASALMGKWMTGSSLQHAAIYAAHFVTEAIGNTCKAPAHGYGVKFETALHLLWE